MTARRGGKAVSDLLEEVSVQGAADDRVTLYELKMTLRDRGFGVLMLLFALPLSIPIPCLLAILPCCPFRYCCSRPKCLWGSPLRGCRLF